MTSRETLHKVVDNLPDDSLDQALQSLLQLRVLRRYIPELQRPLPRWKVAIFVVSLATALCIVAVATHQV
jgi:hypothetical protein